jgi:hypothetical protein
MCEVARIQSDRTGAERVGVLPAIDQSSILSIQNYLVRLA